MTTNVRIHIVGETTFETAMKQLAEHGLQLTHATFGGRIVRAMVFDLFTGGQFMGSGQTYSQAVTNAANNALRKRGEDS